MLRRFLIVFSLGLVWLFVFSIPVDRDRRVFDVGHSALVDTKPMHWLVAKIRSYFDRTRDSAAETAESVIPEALRQLSKAEGSHDVAP